jgi:hypothetical protein
MLKHVQGADSGSACKEHQQTYKAWHHISAMDASPGSKDIVKSAVEKLCKVIELLHIPELFHSCAPLLPHVMINRCDLAATLPATQGMHTGHELAQVHKVTP